MKKAILMLVMMFFVSGCHRMYKTLKINVQDSSQEITTKHCSLSPFRSIVLKGNATVSLVNGSYAIDITGTTAQTDKYNCQNSVINQVLYVNVGDNKTPNTVEITAPELRNIIVADNVTVKANNFKSDELTIVARGYSTVTFNGKYNIDKLFQLSRGKIKIDWIASDNLLISGSDNGPILLAGTVNNMIVKLTKNAKLNARYLRAKKASVITADMSQAKITALDTLDAFALDKSNIYYYDKKPKNVTVVTRDSANVLRLN